MANHIALKNIYGPYERKVVMDQGNTKINGPHQGSWVNTVSGEDWFIHFQDKDAYGRILHLQPMKWTNDWPVIGVDLDGDGKGEPVMTYQKPNVGSQSAIQTPPDSDEFDGMAIGKQWQWQANPKSSWMFLNKAAGTLRLYSAQIPDSVINLWKVPNLLLQKFPAENFTATTKLVFHPQTKIANEKVGLVIMGMSYAELSLVSTDSGINLQYATCKDAEKGATPNEKILLQNIPGNIYLRVTVSTGAKAVFSYSMDGIKFTALPESFQAVPGKWIGAKIGIFNTRKTVTNDAGSADFDWFRFDPIQ